MFLYIYIYICTIILLSIHYNNYFDNQGSEINKNDSFLRSDKLSFTKTFFLLQIKNNFRK